MRDIMKRLAIGAMLPLSILMVAIFWPALAALMHSDPPQYTAAKENPEPPETLAYIVERLDELRDRIHANDMDEKARHETALSVYATGLETVRTDFEALRQQIEADLSAIRTELEKLRAQTARFASGRPSDPPTLGWAPKIERASSPKKSGPHEPLK